MHKEFIQNTTLEAGYLLSYKHNSGNLVLLRIVAIDEKYGGSRYPRVEILDFFDTFLPNIQDIKALKPKTLPAASDSIWDSTPENYNLWIHSKKESEPWDRLTILEKGNTWPINRQKGAGALWWKNFDEFLVEFFKN